MHPKPPPEILSPTELAYMSGLNERDRRLFLAARAESLKSRGLSYRKFSKNMGISTHTLQKGLEELHSGHSLGKGRVRRDGGGRHATLPQHPEWLRAVVRIIESHMAGLPQDEAVRWVSISKAQVRSELAESGYEVSRHHVTQILDHLGLRERSFRKDIPMRDVKDRNEQFAELDIMIRTKEPVADREDAARRFNLLDITFNADDTVKSYEVNQKKLDTMLLTAGFFANKTIGVDFDPMQAMDNYGMRDEQEKCFALQKGPLGHDRLRTWSEGGKRGRMFIYFVGLILASYVRSVWQSDEVLRKRFTSTEAVLAEMRTIRCVEHTGKVKFITPFVGSQVDICKAFGFSIPDGCAPVYVSKAKNLTRKRGRPAKAKTENQEL